MKKILSFIFALLLLLSISGCTPDMGPVDVQPQQTTTVPETAAPVEKVVILNLIGRYPDQLPETDNFVVEVVGQEHSDRPAGTIIRQDLESGAWVDKGTTVHVVTSLGQIEVEQPQETEPQQTRPQPDRPEQVYPQPTEPDLTDPPETEPELYLDPDGSYTTKEDVALYIYLYGELPNNFITKKQAENLYGKTSGLNKYGKCIGGDRFYNREGNLPGGYTYYECDIDTLYSSKRGAKRLVFTYSGIIYYTDDHYRSFTRLY